MKKIRHKLGFRRSFVVDPIGRASGVAFMWNDDKVNLKVEWNSERIIQFSMWNDCGLKIENIVACYGMPYLAESK